jgi:protein TonB
VDIDIAAPSDTSSAISANAKRAAPAAPPATVPPRSNPRRPVTQPDYPPTSKRLGEAGTVVMLLTVDESGKVIEAKVDKSSGFERLDQAAINEALRAWRLLPGTVGGKPVTMQYKFAVTFKITD